MRFDWLRKDCAAGPIATVNEHEHRLADGRWLRIRERPTPGGGRILLTTDVTEQHRQAEEIRMLASAVEQVIDPVEITDAAHGFVYVNRAFETTTGWRRNEALGRKPQDLLSSGHTAEFFDDMQARLKAGESWHGTIVNRHRVEQETTISPLRDETGAITHYVAVKRDVTEARAQARALAESEARYRAVVETQTEFVVRIGPKGRWTFMNEACERYLGRTMEELNACGITDPVYLHPDDWPVFNAHIASLTPGTPTHTVEWRALHPDGSLHWEQWTDTALFDEAGELLEIQCVGRLITDKKAVELELSEREAQFRTIACPWASSSATSRRRGRST